MKNNKKSKTSPNLKKRFTDIILKLNTNKFIPIFISLSLIILVLALYKDFGLTWDEGDTMMLGNYGLVYYLTLGAYKAYFTFFNQPEFYLTRGPIIETLRAFIMVFFHNYSIETYHLILGMFALLSFYFLYKILNYVTKNPYLGLLGCLILVTTPRFFGDMFTNSKDISPLYALLGIIYFSILYFKDEVNKKNLYLLAIFFALGISMRVVLFYVYILFVLTAIVIRVIEKKESIKIFFGNQVRVFLPFLLILHLFQPYLLKKPIIGILDMVRASEKFPQIMPIIFEGKVYQSNNLPWYYLPKWIAISTPIITLLFFAVGNIYILKAIFTKQNKDRYIFLYVLLIFWAPILIAITTHPVLYNAWRHFLFLIGPFTLMSIIGFYYLFKSKLRFIPILSILILLLGVSTTVVTMVKLHPYEYVYFNPLVGGLKGASEKYELDYWGASFKEATEWVDKNGKSFSNKNGALYVNPCMPHLSYIYLEPEIKINPSKATISYCYINKGHKQEFGKIIHVVERENVPLNIIELGKTKIF